MWWGGGAAAADDDERRRWRRQRGFRMYTRTQAHTDRRCTRQSVSNDSTEGRGQRAGFVSAASTERVPSAGVVHWAHRLCVREPAYVCVCASAARQLRQARQTRQARALCERTVEEPTDTMFACRTAVSAVGARHDSPKNPLAP